MGELLRNSLPVSLKRNGFACQNCLLSNYDHRNVRKNCGIRGTSSRRGNRRRMGTIELNLVSMSEKGNGWFGFIRLEFPKMSLMFRSNRVENLHVASNAVGSSGSRLILLDYKEKECVQSADCEPENDSFRENLPPWGDLVFQQESGGDAETTVQSSFLPETTVVDNVDKSRVHFLEETNEEELSRRILVLSRSNKVRSAMELFKSIELSSLRISGHACNSLLSCLLRNKLLDHALRIFEFMKANEIATAHTYSLILKAVAGARGVDSALDTFTEMELHSNEDFDVIVYNTIISICGKVNNWIETERVWKGMMRNGHCGTQVTYELLVSIFVRCGQNELALDAYDEMVQKGLKTEGDIMQAIISASTKEGKWDLALNVFQNMLNSGLEPNLVSCNALMNSLGKAGEVKLAFKVFKVVESLGHTPDAYTWNALLGGLYRANQHANALQLFESIRRDQCSQLNEHIYNTALMSCQKLRLWDRALQILWQMEASGQAISTASYNIAIGACETARKPKVALQVYEHMIHQECTPDTFTYLSLIRGCVWASLWSEVDEILEVAPDVSIYNAVIHGMCLRGKIESAKNLYAKMREKGLEPDGKTRAMMLQNLRKVSNKGRRRRLSARRR